MVMRGKERPEIMTKNEIICYQFAERLKTALIISSKMLQVLETLRDSELEGAKKLIHAFFDALSSEAILALNATGMEEFGQVEEKVNQVRWMIEVGDFQGAQETVGGAVTHATTVCANTMSALMEKKLI